MPRENSSQPTVGQGIRILSHETIMKSGIALISAERERQQLQEGYGPHHDDQHESGELNDAAMAYAFAAAEQIRGENHECIKTLAESANLPKPWPWENSWWKPSEDPIRNLVKAGALIASEIDRLQRQSSAHVESTR